MAEYIEKAKLYENISRMEEVARNRFLDTPFDSPARTRYQAQLNERTSLKHMVNDMKPADVAPVVHGRWIFNDDWWEFRCTECHRAIGNIEKYNYCPHCGAKMDGGEKDGV